MTERNPFIFSRPVKVAAISLGTIGFLMTASAQAHAAQTEAIAITSPMPKSSSQAHRKEAIQLFKIKATEACTVQGRRGVSAFSDRRECVSDLVDSFKRQIDVKLAQKEEKAKQDT